MCGNRMVWWRVKALVHANTGPCHCGADSQRTPLLLPVRSWREGHQIAQGRASKVIYLKMTDRQTDRHVYIHMYTYIHVSTYRQTDRQRQLVRYAEGMLSAHCVQHLFCAAATKTWHDQSVCCANTWQLVCTHLARIRSCTACPQASLWASAGKAMLVSSTDHHPHRWSKTGWELDWWALHNPTHPTAIREKYSPSSGGSSDVLTVRTGGARHGGQEGESTVKS